MTKFVIKFRRNAQFSMAQILLMSVIFLGFVHHDDGVISWSATKKLSWADFHGTPSKFSEFKASTSSKISLDCQTEDAVLNCYVQAKFIKSKSWVKEGEASDLLLIHEQRHFDLTEYSSRCLKEAISSYKFRSMKTLYTELDSIYKQYKSANVELQYEYDDHTEHSKNRNQQEVWNKKIDSLLSSKSQFEDIHLQVNIGYLYRP